MLGFLVACGNLQAVKVATVPRPVLDRRVEISEVRPTKEEVMPRGFEVPNRSAFILQTSGGSTALGILLGPLGVMANASNIDRLTKELGESSQTSSLLQIDAKQEAQTVSNDFLARFGTTKDSKKVLIKPFIVYFVADEKVGVDVLVQFRAESEVEIEGKPSKWIGNYSVYLNETLPLEALTKPIQAEKLNAIKQNVANAYKELFEEYVLDVSRTELPKRDIAWVKSRVLGIGMPGDLERNKSGHLVLRAMFGDWGRTYNIFVFQNDKQYQFDNGPVPRQ